MKGQFIIFLTLLTFFLSTSCSKELRAYRIGNRGIKQAEKENYAGALVHFERAIAVDSANLNLLLLKATALSDLERYSESETLFFYLIRRKLDDSDLYYNLSRLYLDQKMYEKALLHCEGSLLLDSTSVDAFTTKAEILIGMTKYSAAKDVLFKALSIKKNDYAANLEMADVYYYEEVFAEAEKYCNIAIKENSKNYGAYLTLYTIFSKKNDKPNACKNYKLALKHGMSSEESMADGMIKCE